MKLYIYKLIIALLAVALVVSCGVQQKNAKTQSSEQAKGLASTGVSDQNVASYSSNLQGSDAADDSLNNLPDSLLNVKALVDSLKTNAQNPDSAEQNSDSVTLSLLDSLKAKYSDNGTGIQWNDSIAAAEDSAKKNQNKSMLDAKVDYTAKDSIIFVMGKKNAYLYGDGKVNYENIELTSEEIAMNLDSSIVHAVGVKDSLGVLQGTPVFKQGSDSYESETMSYNFKTKKGYITNVYTEQQDGFLRSGEAKKSGEDELYLRHGKYTTCDKKHPHFYIALSRGKVHTGKNIFAGPAWLVVEDVPLPLAIPFAYFPFTKSFSSGFIMPSYGDESTKGFYLRNGGYYFAFSDYFDLKLTGEIFTKGSWGITGQTTYKKRYKFSGSFSVNYLVSKTGEKNLPDYSASKDLSIQWTHSQDAKAGNNSSFSASVNFQTSSYEKNNLSSLYDQSQYSQSQRSSSISYSKSFPKLGLSISSSFNINQNVRDSSLSITLPSLSISLSRKYPFKRKKAAGKERWYEKIGFTYTGNIDNSISTKENMLFKSNLVKDWKNGMKHSIPVSASFNLLNYIDVTPSFNYTARWYTHKIMQSWDDDTKSVKRDTIYGFNHVHDFNLSLDISTKLYGFFTPNKKIFGDKIQKIRHYFVPTVTFSWAPDFSNQMWGSWKTYTKTDEYGNVSLVNYSPYSDGKYGVPPTGKTGSVTFSVDNNVEMKIKDRNDSIRKVSIIDLLGADLSYNMAAKEKPWGNLNTRLRLKFGKTTINLNATFYTYAYQFDKNGNVVESNRTEWSYGRFGRFGSISKSLSYTFNNQSFKQIKNKIIKLFGGEVDDEDDKDKAKKGDDDDNGPDDPDDADNGPNGKGKKGKPQDDSKDGLDADGYMKCKFPWAFSISYSVSLAENRSAQINVKNMRYPYALTHTLNFSGNFELSSSWKINFSSGWDFNYHKLSMTTVNISRDMHCFNISAGLNFGVYTSYNVTLRANASTLTDALKYDKRSSYSSSLKWY